MRKFQIVLAAAGLALAAGTPSRAADCADQNTYFPLTPGAVWTYRTTITDNTGKETVQTTVRFIPSEIPYKTAQIAGELQETIETSSGGGKARTLVRVIGRAVFLDDSQRFLSDSNDSLAPAKARGFEHVVVPAGNFMAIRKVDSTINNTLEGILTDFVSSETRVVKWFAPGVGLVKMELSSPESGRAPGGTTVVAELTNFALTPCCDFTVTNVEGNATVDGKPVKPGMRFSGHSKVAVAGGGKMELAAGDGSTLRISGEAKFSLSTICTKDGQQRQASHTTIEMMLGKMWNFISNKFGNNEFKVNTSTCVVGVRGTEFYVEVANANGRQVSRIEVVEGSIWVRKKGETNEIILHAGEKGEF